MIERKDIYDALRLKMEEAGFQFQKEQKPHLQNRREPELKFTHPQLDKKLELEGHKILAKKYYVKQLSDDIGSEIGFVTGKSSPLYSNTQFTEPNSIDSFDGVSSWTNRDDNPALDNLLLSIKSYLITKNDFTKKTSNTFLFTWNPSRWEWSDLDERIEALEKLGYTERRWSCGNSKVIQKGDRVFLITVGKEPRGIIGSGYAKSSYYIAPHWDGTVGKTANYVDVEFDILINPSKNPSFDKILLDTIDTKNIQQWSPQQGGISIKSEVIDSLESGWFDFITTNKHTKNTFLSNDLIEGINQYFFEGKSKDTTQTRYERSPAARKRCLQHHGYFCKICNFNFEEQFGELGKGFIHVHHINQISEIGTEYQVNAIKDLIPVCPNCHSMIHSKKPAFSIEQIISIRKNANNQLKLQQL